MRRPFLWAIALLLSFGLSGCLFSAFLAGESRLQLENGSRMAIAELEAVGPGDTVLLVDDFLANGAALRGLVELCGQAGASVAGAAIAIEKAFQGGGDALRQRGVRVESLAVIESMDDGIVTFRR